MTAYQAEMVKSVDRLDAESQEAFVGVAGRFFGLLSCEREVACACMVRIAQGFEPSRPLKQHFADF